ncbi:sugar ABC transporter substrate-binding protein [Herpetosiphon gulosus]|uniref:Extracellular solute-binding protein n=1 Tax=Herpetosiphon gulosus TaxID=1973496 RepID=A0ABP9X5K9_9CHLR
MQRSRRPFITWLSLLTLISMILVACGGAETAPTATTAPAATATTAAQVEPTAADAPTEVAATAEPATAEPAGGDVVTLKLWHMPNGAAPADAIQAEIDAFEKANPGINVEPEMLDWGAAFQRIQTSVQGGEGPCLTQLGTTWNPTFAAMGGLRPFTAEEITAMGGSDSFVAASWATSQLQGMEGTFSIPWFADVRALAYRKDLLEKAGLKPEEAFKDWTSFKATLATIQEQNPDVAGIAFPGRNDWNVWQNSSMWIWNSGGDLLSSDLSEATFNSEAAVAGVSEFANLYSSKLTVTNTLELNSAQVDASFGDGRTFSAITGPWLISNARTAADAGGWANRTVADNLAYAEFPAGPGGSYTFVGGSNLAILKSCENADAAVKFVQFLAANESQLRYSQAIGMLPATKTAQADASIASDALYSVFISAAAKGKTSAPIAEWGQVESVLNEQLGSLWDDVATAGGPVSPEAVKTRLDQAAQTVNELLGN